MNAVQRLVVGVAALSIAVVLFTQYPKHMVEVPNPAYNPKLSLDMLPDSLVGTDAWEFAKERTIPIHTRHRPDPAEVAVRYVGAIVLVALGLFCLAERARGISDPKLGPGP